MNTNSDVGNMSAHPCLAHGMVWVLYRMALRHSAPRLLLQLAAWAQSFITWYVVWFSAGWGVGFLKASLNITVNTFMLLSKIWFIEWLFLN